MTWRIDDLAHMAGITVDTVRYYQRERLLPAPTRSGRHALYGPDHLQRLERIKELQGRGFSLAAIRALLDTDRPGLVEGIFGATDTAYSLDELVRRSDLDPELAAVLRDAGVLRDPDEFGRDGYDNSDLDMCRAVAALSALGLSDDLIADLGRIYTEGVERIQQQVLELFASRADTLAEVEQRAFTEATIGQASELLPLVERLVSYVHRRTIQRLTLNAIARQSDGPSD